MSTVQKILVSILPRKWATAMEAESRQWMLRCSCGHERSVWEAGGVRWHAKGESKRFGPCPACGKQTWQTLYHKLP